MGSQQNVVGTAADENMEWTAGKRLVDESVEKRVNWTSVGPSVGEKLAADDTDWAEGLRVGVKQVVVEPTADVAAEDTD